jgi:hypothetical protein
VFVSNVNNGAKKNKDGNVTRLNLMVSATGVSVVSATVIAKGYTVEPNNAALVLGPTGLAYAVGRVPPQQVTIRGKHG